MLKIIVMITIMIMIIIEMIDFEITLSVARENTNVNGRLFILENSALATGFD